MTAAGKYLAEHLLGQRGGEADDIERGQRPTAHGINVAQSVRYRDLSESVRVVHDWREEVDGLHQRSLVVHPVHRRVVPGGDSDQQIRVADFRKLAQDLSEILGTEL